MNSQFVQQYDALKPADGFPNDWSYDTYMSVLAYAKAIQHGQVRRPGRGRDGHGPDHLHRPARHGEVRRRPAPVDHTVLVFQTTGDATSDTKLKLLKWDLVNPQSGQMSQSGS